MNTETFRRKNEILDDLCRSKGRDPKTLKRSIEAYVSIGKNPSDAKAKIFRAGRRKAAKQELVQYYISTGIAGTPELCANQIRKFVGYGAEHFMLVFTDLPSTEGLELFAEKVIPDLAGN